MLFYYVILGRKFAKAEIKTIAAYLIYSFDVTFKSLDKAIEGAKQYDGGRAGLGTITSCYCIYIICTYTVPVPVPINMYSKYHEIIINNNYIWYY